MLGSNILVDSFFVCIIRVSQFGSILHHDLADLSWSVLGWRMPVSEHCNSLEWRGSNRSGSLRRSYEFLAWKGHSDEIWWDGVKRCPDQLNSGKRIKQMPKKTYNFENHEEHIEKQWEQMQKKQSKGKQSLTKTWQLLVFCIYCACCLHVLFFPSVFVNL